MGYYTFFKCMCLLFKTDHVYHIYIYIYIYTHTRTHTYSCVYYIIRLTVLQELIFITTQMQYPHTHTHTYTHTCIHTHIRKYTHIHAYIRTYHCLTSSCVFIGTSFFHFLSNYKHHLITFHFNVI